eukprot:6177699-Pleurochrysis_carterae.AAC.1
MYGWSFTGEHIWLHRTFVVMKFAVAPLPASRPHLRLLGIEFGPQCNTSSCSCTCESGRDRRKPMLVGDYRFGSHRLTPSEPVHAVTAFSHARAGNSKQLRSSSPRQQTTQLCTCHHEESIMHNRAIQIGGDQHLKRRRRSADFGEEEQHGAGEGRGRIHARL